MGTWIVLGVVIVAAIAALVFICKNGGWGGCGGDSNKSARAGTSCSGPRWLLGGFAPYDPQF